jgi:hypothetical protein
VLILLAYLAISTAAALRCKDSGGRVVAVGFWNACLPR